jgi:ferrous iron transport protein A
MAVWAAVVAMTQLRRGQTAVVEELRRPETSFEGDLSQRLRELGFHDGEEVQVLAAGAAGGPLAVRVGETTFALRLAEAERVRVRCRPH